MVNQATFSFGLFQNLVSCLQMKPFEAPYRHSSDTKAVLKGRIKKKSLFKNRLFNPIIMCAMYLCLLLFSDVRFLNKLLF